MRKIFFSLLFGLFATKGFTNDNLDVFLKEMISYKSFGYTIFGEKPVTIECWLNTSHPPPFHQFTSISIPIQKSYYASRDELVKFNGKHYLIGDFSRFDGITEIYFINIYEANKIIRKNRDLFGKNFDILHFLQSPEIYLNYHEKLGVLLGYGRGNSKLFANMTICNRWGQFSNKCKYHSISKCRLPCFMADLSSEETGNLYKSYSKTREKITKILDDPNFSQILREKLGS